MIAEHLTIDEVADIKDLFDRLDVRHAGQITFDELKDGLRKAGHDIPNSDALMLMEAVSILFLDYNDFNIMLISYWCQYQNL